MSTWVVWIVIATAFVGGASLAYVNAQPVTLDYLAGVARQPLIVWLGLAFLLGVLASAASFGLRGLKLRSDLRAARRQLEHAEAELNSLRDLPSPRS